MSIELAPADDSQPLAGTGFVPHIQLDDSVEETLSNAQIKVVGVGGGGGNAVEHMIQHGVRGVEFISANTDAQSLKRSSANHLLHLGASGLGAGARPEVGEACALEAENSIRERLVGAQMVFITAGLGGGTGTGAAPVIARIAKEMGVLTVGVVTKPFDFEGGRRMRAAEEGLRQLEKHVDSLIVVLNDRLLDVMGEDVTQDAAFKAANDVLRNAVGGITNVIHIPGLVNVDFEDVKTVMEQPGRAMMGTAQCAGPDRSHKAAEQAIACPLLEGIDLSGANGVLVLIAASRNTFKLSETRNVMNAIRRYAHSDAHIIMGAAYEEDLGDEMRVTVIATGLSAAQRAARPSVGAPVTEQQMAAPMPSIVVPLRTGTDNMVMDSFEDDLIPGITPSQRSGLGGHMTQPSQTMAAERQPFRPSVGSGSSRPIANPSNIPAVWRTNRTQATARIDALAASGMDEMEIPAFLRKQAD